MNLKFFENELQSLVIFHSLYEQPFFKALNAFFEANTTFERVRYYSDACSIVYESGGNLTDLIREMVLNDENIYVQKTGVRERIPEVMYVSLKRELYILNELAELESNRLQELIELDFPLAQWQTHSIDLMEEYRHRIARLNQEGYGIYAKYHMFGVDKNGIIPITHPDAQTLDTMTGYERERETLLKNTLAFLKGMKANNALLYGDAGTGKSSTIKAIVNEYYPEGLRLIEVKKSQIHQLPALIESLARNPLKFIIFIDDLSFKRGDSDFIALKNILEGGSVSINQNVIVYATSNRHHLVQERMEDREGSDIFRNDTMQETMSLAARFGLTITFSRPNKDLYIDIVKNYAKQFELDLDEEELIQKAEAFALRNNGRSPRTAKQFVEYEKINQII